MKFSTRDDIEAPISQVFAILSDFDLWERGAMRRGAEVSRTDTLTRVGPGMSWLVRFRYRGKQRVLNIALTAIESPARLAFSGDSVPINGNMVIELLELSPRRTRMNVATEIKPKTLGARLVLQSLKLAKAKMDRRFAARVAQFSKDIEARIKNPRRA